MAPEELRPFPLTDASEGLKNGGKGPSGQQVTAGDSDVAIVVGASERVPDTVSAACWRLST